MTKNEIRIPSNWRKSEAADLIQLDAGRAYIEDQDGFDLPTEKEIWSEDRQAAYLIYPDGSLWFVNGSGDEVWSDVASFLAENNMDELVF